MNIAIDIILLLLGISVVIIHIVQGFIRSVFGFFKLFIAIAVSLIITPALFAQSDFFTRAIGYFLIFVAAYVLLTIAIILLDKIFKLPLLNAANRLLGCAVGVVCAYMVLSAVAIGVTVIANLAGTQVFGQTQTELEAGTILYGFFSRHGIFALIDRIMFR